MNVNGPLSFHERFDNAIKGIEGLCQKKLEGSKVSPISKKACERIISLCKKYNNSLYSLQGHDRRVVARAYVKQEVEKTIKEVGSNSLIRANIRLFQKRKYKKDIATNFNTKALDLNFVNTLKGKDLKAFFKVFKSELLNPDNKEIFNNLPPEAQKAFIEQNKGDVEFLSTFSNVYKEELLKPENKDLFNALPGDVQIQFCKTNDLDHKDYLDLNNHEVDQAFVKEYKKELLNPDNKTFFNSLPIEAKKAFIEQNKGDVEFLSTFSNIYKEELAYVSFSSNPMPELLTVFKDAIVSNRDKIIENPTILAYADKATLESIIEPIIKGDEELGKALIQSFLTIDKNYLQNLTLMFNIEFSKNTKDIFLSMLQNENVNQNEDVITSNQLFKDIERGYTFEFTCPSGKKVVINNNNNKTSQGNFLSKREIFDEIKKQINSSFFMEGRTDKEVEKDLNSLADFIANCGGQDLMKNLIPNSVNCIHWEGNGCPFYKAHHDGKRLTIEVHTQGSGDKNNISFGSKVGFVKLKTKATVAFYYENSIEACKGKASNIEVNQFEQEIGDVTFL
ncbi:MAG: hypothetical protein ACLRFH_02210 [Opitutales bacterium]